MKNKTGLYIFSIALLISIFSIWIDSPPAVINESAPDSVFSATRAYTYLQEICKAPHSTGTPENKRVREYIVEHCKQWGLDTHIQNTTAIRKSKTGVYAANVYNVIARLKGQDSKKCLVVMAHYDTQPNTVGAGDDGAGVAAMMETARILTSTNKVLKNDVVFLFTDAEESGLLGAQGFIQDSVMANEVGLVLNFEGRGSSGVSTMFEVNSKNGWAVQQYKIAADYPVGSSLGYEIYKTLPNDTDYTIFRNAGISGLNHGFIEGFVNYHSPNDKPENLDLRSLQHHGSNMLSMVKHFGNLNIVETKADDISFFNVSRYYMFTYPASWNLNFVIFCFILLLSFVIIGFRKKQITLGGFAVGFFAFIGLLVFLFFTIMFFVRGIESAYPLYKHFYASNSYNIYYYFTAFTSLSIVMYAFLYRWLLTKFSLASLLAGILLLQVFVLALLYVFMPTAIFIILFPLIFTLIGNIILLLRTDSETTASMALQLCLLVPALYLLSSAVLQMFTVFGLSPQVGAAVVLLGLLLGLLLPVFSRAFDHSRNAVIVMAVICFVAALIGAHFNSGFTEQQPLQSNVLYQIQADDKKAYWISDFTTPDDGNKQYFSNFRIKNDRIQSDAPLIAIGAPTMQVLKDTVEGKIRKLYLHCQSTRNAISMLIAIGDKNPAQNIFIDGPGGGNGNKRIADGRYRMVDYAGLDSAGFNITIETKPNLPFELTLTDRSIGLPTLDGYDGYPKHVIPGVGWNSNTIQVARRFVF